MIDFEVTCISELGKKSEYDAVYNPDRLLPLPRKNKRNEIGVPNPLPFSGFDLWNHYEVSWLNEKGKPIVALAQIIYGCNTPNIIESKSMKLYFNSFNYSKFKDVEAIKTTIENDISKRVGGAVNVGIFPLPLAGNEILYSGFEGICIDDLDIEVSSYTVNTHSLTVETVLVEESLYSNLLKSNCLVTNQPDWGSVLITYKGRKINREGLLRYLISFRNHNEFHEQCIERIFMDILRLCQPKELTVYCRYTRRGGLDINPYRSTKHVDFKKMKNDRLSRQ
ncbi:MAG: NADPH-dependent 7-cyano-7-deazaguanine reductase QueF [Gammaproteobacteria bacterium]|nr:NADPH-dependent 7-cyano-7-deazaguanine reductase QueF [Gammaproteobacteria bacterium]